jgi:hypothetical protein
LIAYFDSRGSAFIASLVIIAGQAWLARVLALGPASLLPVLSAVLLAGSVAVFRSEDREPSKLMRWFAGGVVAVLGASNAMLLLLLVRGVFVKSLLGPPQLLIAGVVLWVINVAVFALGYWEIDAGGPESRARKTSCLPDLVFPQQQPDQEGLAPADWTPGFADYLYVSVTAATAFSPTDAMPYSRTAKLVMGSESLISFAIVAMLVARAVNVAKG